MTAAFKRVRDLTLRSEIYRIHLFTPFKIETLHIKSLVQNHANSDKCTIYFSETEADLEAEYNDYKTEYQNYLYYYDPAALKYVYEKTTLYAQLQQLVKDKMKDIQTQINVFTYNASFLGLTIDKQLLI